MNTMLINRLILAVMTLMVVACESNTTAPSMPSPEVQKKPEGTAMQCKDPRPEFCTKEYSPVCATKDTGVRCVTTPCPSTENVTYSNGCTACADAKVYSHVMGACQ